MYWADSSLAIDVAWRLNGSLVLSWGNGNNLVHIVNVKLYVGHCVFLGFGKAFSTKTKIHSIQSRKSANNLQGKPRGMIGPPSSLPWYEAAGTGAIHTLALHWVSLCPTGTLHVRLWPMSFQSCYKLLGSPLDLVAWSSMAKVFVCAPSIAIFGCFRYTDKVEHPPTSPLEPIMVNNG